jgi:circadian clock protein KaiB
MLFKLFIAGRSRASRRAIASAQRLCEEYLGGQCHLVIVDTLKEPELAEQEQILATPTLIRVSPAPRQRFVGELSAEHLVQALGGAAAAARAVQLQPQASAQTGTEA